jgi:hypothetical protein
MPRADYLLESPPWIMRSTGREAVRPKSSVLEIPREQKSDFCWHKNSHGGRDRLNRERAGDHLAVRA